METERVHNWMTSPVISVTPDTAISIAHQMMKDKRVRRLPVVERDRVVGIITLGDVREASPSDATTLSIWELNYLWSQLTVERVMTKHVITITPDAEVYEAAQLMLDRKLSGLPVVDTDKRLIGMITESDIFRMLIAQKLKERDTKEA